MKLKYIFLIITGIILLYSVLKKIPTSTDEQSSVCVVGTSADYPPYAFIDLETHEIKGFDVDVVREVGRRIGKNIVIKDMPFESLILSLLTGGISMIAAGLSPTADRAKAVLFSHSYVKADPFVVVSYKKNKVPASIEALQGKTVVVNSGHTAEKFVSGKTGFKIVSLATPADAIMALKNGIADVYVSASSAARALLEKQEYVWHLDTFVEYAGDGCALAVQKNNTTLAESVNAALDDMERDGTLDQLKHKWDV